MRSIFLIFHICSLHSRRCTSDPVVPNRKYADLVSRWRRSSSGILPVFRGWMRTLSQIAAAFCTCYTHWNVACICDSVFCFAFLISRKLWLMLSTHSGWLARKMVNDWPAARRCCLKNPKTQGRLLQGEYLLFIIYRLRVDWCNQTIQCAALTCRFSVPGSLPVWEQKEHVTLLLWFIHCRKHSLIPLPSPPSPKNTNE